MPAQLMRSSTATTVTCTAATEVDLLPGGSTGTSAPGDSPPDIVVVTITETGGVNDIDTIKIYTSACAGASMVAIPTTYSLSASGSKTITLRGYCGGPIRVTGTSTSGATASVCLGMYQSSGNEPFQLVIDGVVQSDSKAADIDGNVAIGGDFDVGGDTTVVGFTASGDIDAAGGFRQAVGPFYVTTAASQSAVGLKLGDTVGMAWVADRAGSVVGVSGFLDTAVTGAGKSIKLRVYKALAVDPTTFSLLNAALDLDFTQAGGELVDLVTATKGTYTFAAGDSIKLVYTTDAISNTPHVAAFIRVEC